VSIQAPKGTRDFYPETQRIQNFIFEAWKRVCLRYGYEEYEGPIFEDLELFTGKSGDEIVTQLYNFQDKGGRDLALRPEMTPTLARLVNQKGQNLRKPFRWFSIPRLYRYERSQKGRLREFFQLNMDIIGTDSIHAEADLISAIIALLKEFKLEAQDFQVGISSRKLLAAVLSDIGISDSATVLPLLDKRAKMPPEKFEDSLQELGLNSEQINSINEFMKCTHLNQMKTLALSDNAKKALEELEILFEILTESNLEQYIAIDTSVIRGLAYYTGIVFEVFDKNKSMRAIAGGGRYDNLCEKLGGDPVTGVGFGVGDVVLKDLLSEKNLLPLSDLNGPDFYLIDFGENFRTLFAIAAELREQDICCTHDLVPKKIQKQLENAHKSGAKHVLFCGSDRSGSDQYEVKNLQTGVQKTIQRQNIKAYLNEQPE
jgi:histidyl-tRNA synthetase